MAYLLDLSDRPECHGIGPNSLKVATISSIMKEVVKGNANLAQLAIRGNYREVASRDMAKIYARNVANRKIFVANFALSAFGENKGPRAIATDQPIFSEKIAPAAADVSESNYNGPPASDCAPKHPVMRGNSDRRKRDNENCACPPRGEIVSDEPSEGLPGGIKPKEEKEDKESTLIRCVDVECRNYRFPSCDTEGAPSIPIFLVRATGR